MIVLQQCPLYCAVLGAGALAEAVAQQCEPDAAKGAEGYTAAAAAGASGRLHPHSSGGLLNASGLLLGSGGSHGPETPMQAGQVPGGRSSSFAWQRDSSSLLRQQHSSSASGGSSRLGSSRHTATAAVRVAQEAGSLRAVTAHNTDAATTPNGLLSHTQQQQQHMEKLQHQQEREEEEEQHMLALQFAAASAQLASALATARQVLSDLVLGADPSQQLRAELESELTGLNLEEALSEVVYQVQDKLTAAAAVAEAATAKAAAAQAQAQAGADQQVQVWKVAVCMQLWDVRAVMSCVLAGM